MTAAYMDAATFFKGSSKVNVQATAFRPNYPKTFGYPLIYNVSGTLHTHVLGWKADLDIGGTSNSVNIHEMKVSDGVVTRSNKQHGRHVRRVLVGWANTRGILSDDCVKYGSIAAAPVPCMQRVSVALTLPMLPPPLCYMTTSQTGQADDGIGGKIYINKYDAAFAEKEEDAAYAMDLRTPKIPVVVNENEKNQYGSPRGYKIQLNRPLLNLEPAGYERSKGLGE
jgi:Cu2+-containing amine oxidase